MPRGALIVLEGVDRAGKSTQCKKLVESIPNAQLQRFPDRTTAIGKIINSYLTKEIELSDEAVHLLFSANRWEVERKMIDLLNSGVTLIVDRYAFSGIAFTAAKPGFTLNWCMKPDVGLPKPDRCYYLTLPEADQQSRGDFGQERYEKTDMQRRVAYNFSKIIATDKDSQLWKTINAARTIDEVFAEIFTDASSICNEVSDKPIEKLWMNLKTD